MPGVAVDGQSLRAMRDATYKAINRARAGGGPTLIEAKTYRFVGHSRSDPAKYRLPGELDIWKARDPVRLVAAEIQPDNPDALVADVRARWEPVMAAVVESVKAAPDPAEEDMFRYVYAWGRGSNVLG
jgi:pyruvate dehydrogenase E1 component alpha subunit